MHSHKRHYGNAFLSSVTHARIPWDQLSAFLGKVNTWSPNLATFLRDLTRREDNSWDVPSEKADGGRSPTSSEARVSKAGLEAAL